jgi:hypothetical protein
MLSVGPGTHRFSPPQNIHVNMRANLAMLVMYITDSIPPVSARFWRGKLTLLGGEAGRAASYRGGAAADAASRLLEQRLARYLSLQC